MKRLLFVILVICSTAVLAHAQEESTGYVKGVTPSRAFALGTAVVGILSVVLGWRANAKVAAGTANKSLALTAVIVALIVIIVSVIHLASVTGGFGTGGGKAGAIGALVMGTIGGSLGALALKRANA